MEHTWYQLDNYNNVLNQPLFAKMFKIVLFN